MTSIGKKATLTPTQSQFYNVRSDYWDGPARYTVKSDGAWHLEYWNGSDWTYAVANTKIDDWIKFSKRKKISW